MYIYALVSALQGGCTLSILVEKHQRQQYPTFAAQLDMGSGEDN
jgi:hypothetical protein